MDDKKYHIFICNNASEDDTVGKINAFMSLQNRMLNENNIHISVISETKPGKLNALKSLLVHIDQNLTEPFDSVIFTDAEIEWKPEVYSVLVNYKIDNPRIKLVGARVLPVQKKLGFWGRIEYLTYYGYGDNPPYGHGYFFKFVSGMCYLADRSIMQLIKDEIPPIIGNEDVAVSVMAGTKNIRILKDACVYYSLTENISQFFLIMGRHIRESYRLRRWIKRWFTDVNSGKYPFLLSRTRINRLKRSAVKRFYDISEIRLFKFVTTLFSSSKKLELSIKGLTEWIKNIHAIKFGFYFVFIISPIGLFWYAVLKILAFFQSYAVRKEGWQIIRIGKND
jgi:hypothetical protein